MPIYTAKQTMDFINSTPINALSIGPVFISFMGHTRRNLPSIYVYRQPFDSVYKLVTR